MTDAALAAYPKGTTVTSAVSGGRRKLHFTLPGEDGGEAVEEYDLQTDELLVRKRRAKTVLGKMGEWVYEVGEAPSRVTIENDMLRVSSSNPTLVRKDRPHAFEWRIRNLPYPKSTYSVTVDAEAQQVVVRTSNKKYFKRITIDDMERARLPLEEAALSWSHENNTLIVQYKKPAAVLQHEREAKTARLNAPAMQPGGANAGDLDAQAEQCKQQ